jgi:hypothetical protein
MLLMPSIQIAAVKDWATGTDFKGNIKWESEWQDLHLLASPSVVRGLCGQKVPASVTFSPSSS